jgi:uncharacterized RDD family membrane protein YckC
VVTPEAVRLDVDLAGLGSRGIAIMLDFAIQLGVFYGGMLLFVLSGLASGAAVNLKFALLSIWVFAVFWGYFLLFESIWSGQTPGKRALKIRVVQPGGEPLTWVQSMVRNLVRLIDFLPVLYGIGIVTMLISKRYQRLGDHAAGTIVVHERLKERPGQHFFGTVQPAATGAIDTVGIGEDEYQLARGFLERRFTMETGARAALAAQVAAVLQSRVGPGPPPYRGDEIYVETVAQAYRGRFAPAAGAGAPFVISALPPPPPPPPAQG